MARAAVTGAVHHPGTGPQYTPVQPTETLTLARLAGTAGTAGDAHGNALAETTAGLCKPGPSRDGPP